MPSPDGCPARPPTSSTAVEFILSRLRGHRHLHQRPANAVLQDFRPRRAWCHCYRTDIGRRWRRRDAVILPLVVNQKGVGLFYVDGDDAGARLLSPTGLNSLKVLRGQAVLAIHQRILGSAARTC